MRRAIPAASSVLTAAVLVAGCGASHTTSTTEPGGSGKSASASISKSEARNYAREVNLVASDLPGAEVSGVEHEAAAPSQASIQLAGCAGGVSPTRRVSNIKSAKLKSGRAGGAVQAKSSVVVFPSAGLAARNFAATASARGRSCIARLLPQASAGNEASGVHLGAITTTALPDVLPAGQQSFGVGVSMSASGPSGGGKQANVPIFLDSFALLAGPAEVNLTLTSVSHPVPVATERHLLSLLYDRAQAHKL